MMGDGGSKLGDIYTSVHNTKESVKALAGWFTILKKRGLTWDLFNARKTTIIGKMKTLEKSLDVSIKFYKNMHKIEEVKEAYIDPEIAKEINDIMTYIESPEIEEEPKSDVVDTSTPEGYLEAMEMELFGENDSEQTEVIEERSSVDSYIDELLKQINS
jgi:hypothetical protein